MTLLKSRRTLSETSPDLKCKTQAFLQELVVSVFVLKETELQLFCEKN